MLLLVPFFASVIVGRPLEIVLVPLDAADKAELGLESSPLDVADVGAPEDADSTEFVGVESSPFVGLDVLYAWFVVLTAVEPSLIWSACRAAAEAMNAASKNARPDTKHRRGRISKRRCSVGYVEK